MGLLRWIWKKFLERSIVKRSIATASIWGVRGGTGLKAIALLLALLPVATFLHLVFRHSYLPPLQHHRPLHMAFRSCNTDRGICSFPSAHVKLTDRHQILMVGQSYKITVHLEMPESDANKNLGMFMCCGDLSSRKGDLVDSSCRSSMLKYQSPLLYFLSTIALSPLLILGTKQEKQTVSIELFNNFKEDQNQPVTDINIELQSKFIEVYSATLHIDANFSGLRYAMYHWPYTTALIGICVNMFFMTIVCLLSWYHIEQSFEEDRLKLKLKKEESSPEKDFLEDDDYTKLEESEIKQEEDSQMSEDVVMEDVIPEIINVE